MKLLVTGHTSYLAEELIKLIKVDPEFEIYLAGRNKSDDFFCDFSKFSSIKKFIEDVVDKKHFDCIFLNHGILLGKKALVLTEHQIQDYMMVNCFSVISILEALTKHKDTNIVVTSSISAKEGSYDPIYASTKAGVDSFRMRASSFFHSSVRLNFVSPGVIEDALMTTSRKDQDNVKLIQNKTPTKKLTNSYEVAKIVHYLLINPGNIHCQDFAINGGISLNR